MQDSGNGHFPQDSMFRMFSPAMMLTQSAVFVEGGLAVLAIVIAWFAGIALREMFLLKPLHFLIAVVAVFPMLMFCRFVYMVPFKTVEFTRRFLQSVYRDFIRHCSVLQLLLVAIMSGIGEELLFRGVLQTSITQWFGGETRGIIIGIAITSLLFGLVHPINKLYVFLCFVIGIYLGLLFVWTGNLIVPIIIHSLYNFVVFLAMPQLIGFSPDTQASDA
jgi:membrane protease YdiL (CAAX protease family)